MTNQEGDIMDSLLNEADDSVDMFEEMGKEDKSSKSDSSKGQYRQPRGKSLWERTDFEPLEIDASRFDTSTKSFTIYTYPQNDVPEDAAKLLIKAADALMKKDYTFRHVGDSENELQNKILGLESYKGVSYIPWPKYNPNVKDIVRPKEYGYRVAIGIHKRFKSLPPAVRTILARDVSALLGVDGTSPVSFILTWSDGGDEAINKQTDFKKLGNNIFITQVARRANIPVFNAYNSDFLQRLAKHIKSGD